MHDFDRDEFLVLVWVDNDYFIHALPIEKSNKKVMKMTPILDCDLRGNESVDHQTDEIIVATRDINESESRAAS